MDIQKVVDMTFQAFIGFLRGMSGVWDFIISNEVIFGLISGTTLIAFLTIMITHFLNPTN